jgi:hypothetical protein
MSQPQQVNVTVQKRGCLSGCGTFFLVLVAIGAAIAYWYVAVPLLVLAAIATIIYIRHSTRRQAMAPAPAQQQLALGRTVEVRCAACGEPVTPTATSCSRCGNRL